MRYNVARTSAKICLQDSPFARPGTLSKTSAFFGARCQRWVRPFEHRGPGKLKEYCATLPEIGLTSQVPQTADLFFKQSPRLWVIKLELSKLEDQLKWENGFPHLYGNFGAPDVLSIQEFERGEMQSWADCMSQTHWLV